MLIVISGNRFRDLLTCPFLLCFVAVSSVAGCPHLCDFKVVRIPGFRELRSTD